MFAKSKIAATALILGLIGTTSANAVEVSLETYVNSIVNQAMHVAQQELNNSVQASVLNAAQKLNFDGTSNIKTKVTITDIKSVTKEANKTSEK